MTSNWNEKYKQTVGSGSTISPDAVIKVNSYTVDVPNVSASPLDTISLSQGEIILRGFVAGPGITLQVNKYSDGGDYILLGSSGASGSSSNVLGSVGTGLSLIGSTPQSGNVLNIRSFAGSGGIGLSVSNDTIIIDGSHITGTQGPQGPAGPQGPTGAQGPQGSTGTQGPTGPQGPQGPAGQNTQWLNGAGPPGSSIGNTGDMFLDTSAEDIYKKTSSGWGSPVTNIKGPAGPTGATGSAGANGATWSSGTVVPTGGNNGDFYLKSDTDDIYKNTNGSWSVVTNIKGLTGPVGAAGPTGSTGPTGANGATWSSGTAVPTGGNSGDFYLKTDTDDIYKNTSGTWTVITNIKGLTGSTGSTGPAGINGATWSSGTAVPTGGNSGDFYLKTDTDDIYKNTSGSWSIVSNIKGSTGVTNISNVGSGTGLIGRDITSGTINVRSLTGQNIINVTTNGDDIIIDTNNLSLDNSGNLVINTASGTNINGLIFDKRQRITFSIGDTNVMMYTYTALGSEACYLDYIIRQGSGNSQIGTLMIINDVTNSDLTNISAVMGNIGVTFSASLSNSAVQIKYSVTSGSNGSIAFVARRWAA